MKVYKFGGASVKDAAGVQNLQRIVAHTQDDLVVVVSAIGKTTNALEALLADLSAQREKEADAKREHILACHFEMVRALHLDEELCGRLRQAMAVAEQACRVAHTPEQAYDSLVSTGERLSTMIVAAYLQQCGQEAVLWDMTQLLRTDDTFREAVVDMGASTRLITAAWEAVGGRKVVVAQGFIGGTADGLPTTLGREGSDYTAAIVGNILQAESVTIWKDVPGILNADPRLVSGTTKIDELSYNDAVELAYSGAQVIHPKTIRPLENKHIPLYVKPFGDPNAAGSVIQAVAQPVCVPVYIWRKNQILITLRAKDFSFVLEDSLSRIFDAIRRHRLKVSLIQSSAVTVSVCVDNQTERVKAAIAALEEDYRVSWNAGLSLLTLRGTTPEILRREQAGRTILLSQTTRRTARFVVKDTD